MQYSNLLFLAFMALAFWFLIFRPQQQRTRRQAEMISMLGPGDEVVTIGGIYGVVIAVGERIRLAVAQGEIEVSPQAVARVTPATPVKQAPMSTDPDAEGGDSDA